MIAIQLLIILILLGIFIQDMKSRAVYWLWFPALVSLFLVCNLVARHIPFTELGRNILYNACFIGLQLLVVNIYFSVKNRAWINISDGLLGLGDILLLISVAFYLSFLNYIFFYISSLVAVLICWPVVSLLFQKNNKQIPLAGLQSVILIVFLMFQFWSKKIDLTSDNWLLHLLYQ